MVMEMKQIYLQTLCGCERLIDERFLDAAGLPEYITVPLPLRKPIKDYKSNETNARVFDLVRATSSSRRVIYLERPNPLGDPVPDAMPYRPLPPFGLFPWSKKEKSD